ncbi:kinase-like domain-containing protein [Glomus cerebriforme]|uniref:Kinase-like domain-containing protein n=1 Tax=Glomus cerebriforme TaxID=658196 RepID=A0A397SNM5_9GLOM|nr:kinase-like domain-containing protein [Glomus cerebriforme]
MLKGKYDRAKVRSSKGITRTCKNCKQKCYAKFYCEVCIRNYLKKKFPEWTSKNNDIDQLIQRCQLVSLAPDKIIEWIPDNKIQNINHLTNGGCSEIYTADWIDGRYYEWDSKKQQLKRRGINKKVILKQLVNVKNANRDWLEEARSHVTISCKYGSIVKCYGITKYPPSNDYMLVMSQMDTNLRDYLEQCQNKITWEKRINITFQIIKALDKIHEEGAIHRDLHSGNILYSETRNYWYISDFGFCGPADKPVGCIYGKPSYIAPEVINGKEYTSASDIYSVAMIMWEISSGRQPFADCDEDYDLLQKIINGTRPEIVSGTPPKYKEIMEQCWHADPTQRHDAKFIKNEIKKINKLHQDVSSNNKENFCKIIFKIFNNLVKQKISNDSSKISKFSEPNQKSFTSKASKVYQLENLSKPEGMS